MIQAARRVKLVGMVAVALFLGSPAAAQTPKSCGVINLMERESSPSASPYGGHRHGVAGSTMLQQSRGLRSAQARGERGHRGGGAGRMQEVWLDK
jgi:hypothetical protein